MLVRACHSIDSKLPYEELWEVDLASDELVIIQDGVPKIICTQLNCGIS